jgi:hypothetical protein
MTHGELLDRLKSAEYSGDDIFSLARSVAYFFQRSDTNGADALDLIIRLLERRDEFNAKLPGVGSMIDAIARERGCTPTSQDAPAVGAMSWLSN